MGLHSLTIHELRDMLRRKEVSAVEVTEAFLKRIETIDPGLKSYILTMPEHALEDAKAFDSGRGTDPEAPLAGIPLAIKDVLCTKGIRTTCGSRMLANFIPPYNATVVKLLHAAGAVFLGKTNMDEFAMGSSTENSAFGPTRNPWDLERVPGGSSGGSAAATAADLCAGSIGTDTGGSIRQPASFCGVVGLKPTYGRVSRFGLVAFASSLDQIGPIAKDVEDAAILLQAIAGYDSRDSTSVDKPVPDYSAALLKPMRGLRLGIPKEYFVEGMDPDVAAAVQQAIRTCEGLGAQIVEISLPHTRYAISVYYIIAPAEASSNLARYDGVKYGYRTEEPEDLTQLYSQTRSKGFGPEVKRRIMLGTYVLSAGYYDAYYRKASQVRTLIRQDFLDAFERCDAIVTPVAPIPAFKIGEKTDDPMQMYLSDAFTLPASLAGVPGISVPCGYSAQGLPIGIQILGPHFREDVILGVAHQFEQATIGGRRKPGAV